jgi:hypothetical protein
MMSFDSQLKFSGSSSKQGKWAEKKTFPPAASRLFLHKENLGRQGFHPEDVKMTVTFPSQLEGSVCLCT